MAGGSDAVVARTHKRRRIRNYSSQAYISEQGKMTKASNHLRKLSIYFLLMAAIFFQSSFTQKGDAH
jgi:hypothetical protein